MFKCGITYDHISKDCQRYKGIKIYAYVFMINHLHLIACGKDMISFVRDFKRHTSKEIQNNIIATEPTVLTLFGIGNGKYEFWSGTNMPKMIETEDYLIQKMNYIHTNPVRRQYVRKPEDWLWSFANPESDIVIEPLVL